MSNSGTLGTGWLPSPIDFRDYRPGDVADDIGLVSRGSLGYVDLSLWCSPVDSQGSLGSCTAHAVVNMMEYLQNRRKGKFIDASRIFLYKMARNLMGVTGDTGAYLRSAIAASVMIGSPPEKYWPYRVKDFDIEPGAFEYSLAQNFQGYSYVRHDYHGAKRKVVLKSIKMMLTMGVPVVLGFLGFQSFNSGQRIGLVPMPTRDEKVLWAHAVMICGMVDGITIENSEDGRRTSGALFFKNSWGENWGFSGYGYLPYDYVLHGLAWDVWSLLGAEMVDLGYLESDYNE